MGFPPHMQDIRERDFDFSILGKALGFIRGTLERGEGRMLKRDFKGFSSRLPKLRSGE